MNARLTPFASLTERLPRAIRDLAHRLGKEVELEVQGGAVELDRTVIEALADPLTHLVRNAVDHGLETSAQRISMGKSVRGLLVLSARRERDKVLVEVSDDGAELYGLPMTRIVATTEYDLSARGGEGFEARSLAVMGQLVRAYSLAKLFGLPSLAPPGPRPFAVLEVDGITFALSVDRLAGQEEAGLKPLFPPIDPIKGLAGTTVLGNGRPLLVLDPRGLHELAEASQRLRGAA